MTTITPGQSATVSATLTVGGAPLLIPLTATVTARIFAANGVTPVSPTITLSPSAIGANWQSGVVVADFSGTDTASATLPSAAVKFTVTQGAQSRTWSLQVAVEAADEGSALFPSRALVLQALRRDKLVLAGANVLGDTSQLSDEFLWSKLLAAESVIAGMLRVPLQPTRFFAHDPTPEQLAALPTGMPWAVDPAYDYDPANYRGDRWGFLLLRQKPVQQVHDVKFVYPAPQHVVLNVPADWIRVDKKYGQIQFVPTSSPFLSPIGGLVMNQMAAGRMLPFAIEIEYTAGLADASKLYPELPDVVQKLAVTKIVEDSFLPQSGSISADGLSQSMSVDVSKYHDAIDRIINGPPGANGGLVARIHGIKTMVM
jgi:hypothetical protein